MSIHSSRETSRRKMLWFLLTGAGLLGGCHVRPGYKPVLPESCVWVKFPYTWICVDPEEGKAVPGEETLKWKTIPRKTFDFCFAPPLSRGRARELLLQCPPVRALRGVVM